MFCSQALLNTGHDAKSCDECAPLPNRSILAASFAVSATY
jgi:hypothetical protein